MIFPLENIVCKKSIAFNPSDILDYVPNCVLTRTIIRKTTGNVCAISFDAGEILAEKISPFDNLVQVLEGEAEIIINDKSSFLVTGESIIIPAHSHNTIRAIIRFKMLSTVIKSGYDEVMLEK
jgi:quercetin dioxygenase-like cupin family protein